MQSGIGKFTFAGGEEDCLIVVRDGFAKQSIPKTRLFRASETAVEYGLHDQCGCSVVVMPLDSSQASILILELYQAGYENPK